MEDNLFNELVGSLKEAKAVKNGEALASRRLTLAKHQSSLSVNSKEKRAEWLAQNREALVAYNQRIEERGMFSDGLRRF